MRPLSQIEQAFTITNQVYPLSAVCVLRLQKGPKGTVLQASLNKLQNIYPLLQSFIKEKNGRFWFERDKNKSLIKLKVIERKNEGQWRDVVRQELNLGFDHSESPLMRAIYLKPLSNNEKSEIIFSFHHAVIDSVFLMVIANQLLTLAGENGQDTGHSFPNEFESISPVLADILPQSYKMPRLLLHLVPFVFRQLKDERNYKRMSSQVKDSIIPASSENNILTLDFSVEQTIALIKWSRKNKLSLNSILMAALIVVVNQHRYKGLKKMLRTAQFANLRPYLQPPVSNFEEGCFISMMRFNISLAQNKSIKLVAEQIEKQNSLSAKSGDKFLFFLLSKLLIKKSFREKKERLSATALSYAGPVNLKKQYGNILVDNIHGFITNNCLGPELSGFGKICFGRLSLDLNYLSAEISKEQATIMVEQIKSELLNLIVEK